MSATASTSIPNSTNGDLPSWDILENYFQNGGGGENANPLVKHQIESFNEFLDKKLIQIIQGFNSIQIFHNYNEEIGDFMYKININILQPSITKPMYQTSDGSQLLMTPHTARMNNLTYAVNLYTDIHVVTDVINQDGVTERNENTVPSVCIGRIPMMVRSKGCILTQMPHFADGNGKHECRYDPGGYFIINGNEKVVISQDRISENKTLVFAPTTNSDGLNAEIRSMPDGVFLPPKTTSLHLSAKPNHLGHIIRMNTTFLRSEIPVFTMFRALGIETDKDIISYIVYDLDNPKNQRMITELLACCEDGSEVHTKAGAHEILLRMIGTTGTPREYLEKPEVARQILNNMIVVDFLPHVGPCFRRKALYLGYMVRKLLSTFLGYQNYDNRDSYLHKRIDTTGVLMSNLFRQCYSKMVKEMRNLVTRELNLWRANSDSHANLITSNNVHKFFKPTLLETGMRYALSTGNWGVKTIGTFQNIRQGVAQVLNRMSYLSTLSHLRRINTPMEKSGKLIQPRKLENSQFGMICPAECFDPETPILLWNGNIVKAQEISVGEYLIDDNGNSVKVKSTCSGYKTMYEIIPTKNNFMSYTVTDNHILTLKVKKYKNIRNHRGKKEFMWFDKKELKFKYKDFNNIDELRVFEETIDNDDVIDITIEKYLSLPKNVQKELYTFKSAGIHWEHKDVALDPYILGMWLGDGLSCGYGFVTADKELLNQWIEWGTTNDATIKKGLKYKYHISSTINNTQPGIACNKSEKAPLKKLLEKYNLVKNKHIPLDYLVNDRKTRLAVLAGLIDTDGNVRANGHEILICQGEDNYQIIYDAEFLARSLGFSCHLNDGICSYTVNDEKRHRPYKELTITGQYLYEIPTVLPRKKLNKFDNPTSEKRCSSFLQSSFTLVQKEEQPFVGWQLEGNGRFLLGDMSVVHNTPEGAAVGLVKNMAMSTQITINMSSAYIRTCVVDLGTCVMTDAIDKEAGRVFIKKMGSDNVMHVTINGDLIGYHPEPVEFYKKLKSLKRQGVIAPTTAIVWDIKLGSINISTEAGRMCRPLYIVDEVEHPVSTPRSPSTPPPLEEPVKKTRGRKSNAEKERLAELEKQKVEQDQTPPSQITVLECKRVLRMPPERGDEWRRVHGHKSFIEFVAPLHSGQYIEGFIELMDTDEIDKAMVAMMPKDLDRGIKGTTLPPCYTHCEIHPSLLNGVLAVNIPFSDHNQSPRNCYQCLWVEEPVWMADGGWKKIKDVREGEYVICFHPQTMAPSITRVVHQYVRPNQKTMTLLITSSGRSILATKDHKIMTNRGWIETGAFALDTSTACVGIQAGIPDEIAWGSLLTNENNGDNRIIPLGSLDINTAQRLSEISLYPLPVSHPMMPILSRMVGWKKQGGTYRHKLDQDAFNDDAKYLGFIQYGGNDSALQALLVALMENMDWVQYTSTLAKREMMAGYLGAREVEPNVYVFDDWVTQFLPDMVSLATSSEYSLIYKFGCRYNTIRMIGFSRLDEYIRYKDYMKQRRVPNVMTVEEWLDIVKVVGNTMFVPVFSCSGSRNCMISDITVESENHSFIGGDCFTVSNSAMGKQAVGIYMSNFNHRIDTMAHILNYPQRPLVHTKLSKYTNSETMPSGVNAVVAIMTYTGFNMEDSVMINQSALDRGLFTSTYYKSYRDQCNKNHSTGEEEVFMRPDPTCTANMKPFNYDKIGEDGFVPKNTEIDGNDILVGKIMPHKVQGVIYPRDTSMGVKANDEGFVDMNYMGSNGEGYKFCKIRIRKYRKPVIGDKVACVRPGHEVLTRTGFKPIEEITLEDEVAVLHDGKKMVYEKPEAVHHYPDYEGKMYHISNQGVDLDVTHNHRMWVSQRTQEFVSKGKYKDVWSEYGFRFAEDIVGKRVRYMANAEWDMPDYQFILPEYVGKNGKNIRPAQEVNMEAWLTFFGVWMAEGWVSGNTVSIAANKPRVRKALRDMFPILGYTYSLTKDSKVHIGDIQLTEYMRHLSVGAINKSLPNWVWSLSQKQCRVLLHGMCLGDGNWTLTAMHYSTSSIKLRDDVYRLVIHAGYAAGVYKRNYDPENPATMKDGRKIIQNADGWIVHIRKNRTNPTVNHGHNKEQEIQEEYTYDYKGPVYCLTVSTGVFMVRKNFKHVWTGNSRHAQKGTIGMVYSQEDMPFTKDGIIPDVILNPHAIPSRMTIAQLMESIMGKACTHLGSFGDATPFEDCTVENIASVLEKSGMEKYGNEIMYHGRSGQQIQTEIFIGPTFYQRLKHMVADKAFSRGSNGPVVLLTRQPAEGRARNGGLRFGEMERDCILSYGSANFLKERILDSSDNYGCYICRRCGLLCIANPAKNIYKCTTCKNLADIVQIRIPYSMKLLIQELMSMNVAPRIIT